MYFLLLASFTLLVLASRSNEYEDVGNPEFVLPNILPETYNYPVRVDRIYRRGYGDIDFKEPIDVLEHHMDLLRDPYEEAQKVLVSDGRRLKWQRKKELPMGFQNPRDEMLYYRKNAILNMSAGYPKLYDFTHHLETNLAKEYIPADIKMVDKTTVGSTTLKSRKQNVSHLFEENAFYLKSDRKKVKWSTCDEFARGALFHPDDIVNTQWLPFYVWSIRNFYGANLHKFVYPSKKVVQYYKTVYGPYIKKLNWKQPKLLLREASEMLLIAADRKGLFYGIPRHELSDAGKRKNITLPLVKLRLKIHDPYLALMHCDENFATIMAELGTEPATDSEKSQEAATLKFIGRGKPVTRNIEEEEFMNKIAMGLKAQAEPKKYLDVIKGVPTNL